MFQNQINETTIVSNSMVFTGPFVGEFGWEISHWLPHVRWLRQQYPGRYLAVTSFPGRHPLYYNCVDAFFSLPQDFVDQKYDLDCFESLCSVEEFSKLIVNYKEMLKHTRFSDVLWTRTPRGYNHILRQMNQVVYEKIMPSEKANATCLELLKQHGNKPAVIIFARDVQREYFLDVIHNQRRRTKDVYPEGLPSRNWPRSHWEDLFKMLYDKYSDQVTFVIGGTKDGNCLVDFDIKYSGVINLTEIGVETSLDLTIAFLNNALCCVCSQSGPMHLALNCGCKSFIYGHEEERNCITDNPLKTDVLHFTTHLGGYNESPELLFNDLSIMLEDLLPKNIYQIDAIDPWLQESDKTFAKSLVDDIYTGGKGQPFHYCPETYAENLDDWVKNVDSKEVFLEKWGSPWFLNYIYRWRAWFEDIDISGRILDIGFQDGKTLYQISQKYPDLKIDALDFNPALSNIIPFLKELMPNLEDIWIGDCQQINKPDGYYDAIHCIDFFEHLPEAVYFKAIKEAHRVLKEDGRIFVFVGKTDATAHIHLISNADVIYDFGRNGFYHIETINDMLIFEKRPFRKPLIRNIGMVGVFDKANSSNIPFSKAFIDKAYKVDGYNYRTIAQEIGIERMNQDLKANSKHLDLLIVCKGNSILPSTIQEINHHAITCFYMMDSVAHLRDQVWGENYIKFANVCDFSVVTSGEMKMILEEAYGVTKPICHILQGIDPKEFYPVNVAEKDVDFTFIGGKTEKRAGIIQKIKENGFKVMAYGGQGWDNPPAYKEAFNVACCRSKVCLAISRNPEIDSFSDRILRYMATGSLVLTEYSKGLEIYFENEKDLFWFKDENELIDLAEGIMKMSDAEREAIALNGYNRVLSSHTWSHVAEQIMDIANNLNFNPKQRGN